MMTRNLFLAAVMLGPSAAAAAKPAVLESAEKTYKAKLARIEREHTETLGNAVLRYKRDLDLFAARSRRAGNLDATLAAKAEIDRYTKDKTIPEESPADITAAILLARTKYHKTVAEAGTDKHKNVLKLLDEYTTYLGTVQKKLVSANKLDDAIEIRKAIQEVAASAPVTAAKFALADTAAKTGNASPGTTEPAGEAAEPEYETIEYTKKIGSRGGLMHNWSSTTLRLQKGDEVAIKARGSWQCTHYSLACGPTGYAGAVQYRRDPAVKYGALICKCGSKGTVRYVGAGTTFTSDAGGVLLYFDANILPGRTHRRGCSGNLIIDVTVKRKKE